MKRTIVAALALSFMSIGFTAFAQQDVQPEPKEKPEPPEQPEKKEQQEIIIRSKGDKNVTLKVEINGDNVTINGKPLVEFKDDGITINKRKWIYRDGDGNFNFNFDGIEGMDELRNNLQNLQFDVQKKAFDQAGKAFGKGNWQVHKPFLGVTTEKTTDGAKIVAVSKGSAAEKAGLKVDDVITKIDKQDVTDADVLADIISTKKPKDEIKVYYKRADKKMEAKAVLGQTTGKYAMNFNSKGPNTMVRPFKMPPVPPGVDNLNMDNLNFGVNDMFPRQKRLGLKIQDTEEGGNVKIIEVEDSSAAQKAGLQKDDIITEINGEKITNTDEAREQLQQAAETSAYNIKAKRNGAEMSFDIKFPKKLKTANL